MASIITLDQEYASDLTGHRTLTVHSIVATLLHLRLLCQFNVPSYQEGSTLTRIFFIFIFDESKKKIIKISGYITTRILLPCPPPLRQPPHKSRDTSYIFLILTLRHNQEMPCTPRKILTQGYYQVSKKHQKQHTKFKDVILQY